MFGGEDWDLVDQGRFPFNPKFRKFRLVHRLRIQNLVPTSNGTDHFGLVQPEYSGQALKDVQFDRSGYLGRSVGPQCPFPFDKIVVPSTALLYPAYKNNNQTRGGLSRVCTTGMCPLSKWNFRNFKPEFFLNGKRPKTFRPIAPSRCSMCVNDLF